MTTVQYSSAKNGLRQQKTVTDVASQTIVTKTSLASGPSRGEIGGIAGGIVGGLIIIVGLTATWYYVIRRPRIVQLSPPRAPPSSESTSDPEKAQPAIASGRLQHSLETPGGRVTSL